jgi:hypothetical protein
MTISDIVYQPREILHYLDDVTKQDLMETWALGFDATFASNMAKLAREWECVPLSSERVKGILNELSLVIQVCFIILCDLKLLITVITLSRNILSKEIMSQRAVI